MNKKIFLLISFLSLQILVTSVAIAGNQKEIQHQRTVQSLLLGVNSENTGLKSGCAFMLGELKVSNAVIPLMKLLKENNNADIKIAAALALYKIGDKRGIFAIKMAAQFEQNERVRKTCELFYKNYLNQKENSTVFLSVE